MRSMLSTAGFATDRAGPSQIADGHVRIAEALARPRHEVLRDRRIARGRERDADAQRQGYNIIIVSRFIVFTAIS